MEEVKVFITNLGKYSEGYSVLECGKWIILPMPKEEIIKELESIEVKDNTEYEEYFLSDFYSPYEFLELGEYSNVFKVSELLEQYKDELNLLEAGHDAGLSIEESLECTLIDDCFTESAAGQFLIDLRTDIPEDIKTYIDYVKYYNDKYMERFCTLTCKGLLLL